MKPRKNFFHRKGLYLWDFAAKDIGKPSGDERQAIWKCDSLFILKSLQWIRFSYFRMNIKSIFIFTVFFFNWNQSVGVRISKLPETFQRYAGSIWIEWLKNISMESILWTKIMHQMHFTQKIIYPNRVCSYV